MENAQTADPILYDEHPSMFKNHPFGFLLAVLLIAAFGLGILILAVWYVSCKGTRLIVSAEEVTFEQGILNKSRIDLRTNRIRTVRVDQTLFQRMFGVGTITVYTAGDTPEFSVPGMPDPQRVREIIRAHSGKTERD